jgi:hypothetical protein
MDATTSAVRAQAAPTVFSRTHIFHRTLPLAAVAFGALLALIWIAFLGYVLFRLAALAF